MDLADAGNGRNEWWLALAAEATHLRQGEFEGGGHVLAGHIAGSEDEFPNGILLEGAPFEEVVTDSFVGCEQDPALRSNHRQPSLIWRSALEVVEMALEGNPESG